MQHSVWKLLSASVLRRPQLQLRQQLLLSALRKTLEEETGRLGKILQIPDPDCDVLSYFSVKSTNVCFCEWRPSWR